MLRSGVISALSKKHRSTSVVHVSLNNTDILARDIQTTAHLSLRLSNILIVSINKIAHALGTMYPTTFYQTITPYLDNTINKILL